jgi:hypothetical protein
MECRIDEITNLHLNKLILIDQSLDTAKIIHHQRKEPSFQNLFRECDNNDISLNGVYFLRDGLPYKNTQDGRSLLMIPTTLIESLLAFYHNERLLVSEQYDAPQHHVQTIHPYNASICTTSSMKLYHIIIAVF